MIPQKRSHADLAVWFSLRDRSYQEIGDIVSCSIRPRINNATSREIPASSQLLIRHVVDGMIWDVVVKRAIEAWGDL